MRLPNPRRDVVVYDLASYLTKYLNESYPEKIVVRSFREFDDINVPISDFPLLKVYRTLDNYRRGTTYSVSTAVITYSLSFPDVRELPGILKWVADSINYLLLQYELDTRRCLPLSNKYGYRAEYRLMSSELTRDVYPYLRFNILLLDDLTLDENGEIV